MDDERQEEVAEVEVEVAAQEHQPKQLKLQQYYVMTMLYAKLQKLMQFSTHRMVQRMPLRKKNITGLLRTPLLKVTQRLFPKDGQVFQMESMRRLLIRMERLISSKDRSIGDIMEEISMENTQRR